jgi:hypothetical protein
LACCVVRPACHHVPLQHQRPARAHSPSPPSSPMRHPGTNGVAPCSQPSASVCPGEVCTRRERERERECERCGRRGQGTDLLTCTTPPWSSATPSPTSTLCHHSDSAHLSFQRYPARPESPNPPPKPVLAAPPNAFGTLRASNAPGLGALSTSALGSNQDGGLFTPRTSIGTNTPAL